MLRHPPMLGLSVIPFVMGVVGFIAGMTIFVQYGNSWMTSILSGWFSVWQDNWWWLTLYWVTRGLLFVSVFLLCILSAFVLMSATASPINEFISVNVERDFLGDEKGATSPSMMSWRRWPVVLAGEFGKALVVVMVPLLMLLIPGVNLFAGLVAAFLIGWDFYDYPLARRGWGFKQRFDFVRREFWTVLGFGLWLAIPFIQLFMVPLAVAGGTILNLEALERQGLVVGKTPRVAMSRAQVLRS